ncbi:RDD family protein [Helicobacter trogontum]|uniref:RDD family protein n=1 Tax=Helicobacter trogontum TaxID=50960 RepID=A0A4V6HZ55_9HELI|nr:RDD domain-containing protein [Helicobacter trogontum]TLD83162.1 hypothetical protein LS81_005740 [Helicobacter trogontum]
MKKAKKKQINRFLDGNRTRTNNTIKTAESQNNHNKLSRYNFLLPRLKAFITDMFLLNMPILYITTYVFLQGKEDFLHNQFAIFLCEGVYCIILFLFFVISGQTPGFRYAEIMLCRNSNAKNSTKISKNSNVEHDAQKPPRAWQSLVFILVWLFELCFFLWIFAFLRKDKKTLHEIMSKTHIIYKPNPARKNLLN